MKRFETTGARAESSCANVRMRLSAHHDGEAHVIPNDGLGEACDELALARHMAGCTACADFNRGLDEVASLFDTLRDREPPERVLRSTAARAVLSAARPRARGVRSSEWAVRAAAGLIGFVGVLGLGHLARGPGGAGRAPEPHPIDLLSRAGRTFDRNAEIAAIPERELLASILETQEKDR